MAHHKRRKPKSSRAGCLMCKGWKLQRGKNGSKGAYRGNGKPVLTTVQWRMTSEDPTT